MSASKNLNKLIRSMQERHYYYRFIMCHKMNKMKRKRNNYHLFNFSIQIACLRKLIPKHIHDALYDNHVIFTAAIAAL